MKSEAESVISAPRGVLRPDSGEEWFQHCRRPPCQRLTRLVAHYWYVAWDRRNLPPVEQSTLPHPNIHIVIENGAARVYGVQSTRFIRSLSEQDRVFGIKFQPGGFYPFYKRAMTQLANTSMALEDVFGTAGLQFCDDILSTKDGTTMCEIADVFLCSHLSTSVTSTAGDGQIKQITAWMREIEQNRQILSVEDLMRLTQLEKRSLQRLFYRYVGTGPKWVIQRYRLHEAVAQIQKEKSVNWSEFAQELGYFDQTHFTRDFKRLVGMTPAVYAQSLQAITTD